MNKIIINADDFGLNEKVTSEIERMIEMGAITSTTIMANGECLDEVKRFYILHPEISFGVHLCMTEFSSLTKSPVFFKYGITDSSGCFIKQQLFRLTRYPEDLKEAIHEELRAQIETIKGLGVQISHVDSHHHFHTIYPLHEVIGDTLNEFNIKKIRLGYKVNPIVNIKKKLRKQSSVTVNESQLSEGITEKKESFFIHLAGYIRLVYYRIRLNCYYSRNFTTTNDFFSYSDYMRRLHNKTNKNNIVELMCHPGHTGDNYIKEMGLVESKKLLNNNVKLISYNEL